MNPTATRRAIYGKLAGDSTLNALLGAPATGYSKAIYDGNAPQGASFAYVILNRQDGRPTYAFTTVPAYEQDIWLVKAIDRGPTADNAEAIAARLNALLTDGVLSISGATQLYLRRESDVDYQEVENAVKVHHVGSLYRLLFE